MVKYPFTIKTSTTTEDKATLCVSETGSESFDKFLNLLGENITLQGWAGYRGGLDTKSEWAHIGWIAILIVVVISEKFEIKRLFEYANVYSLSLSCSFVPADDTTGMKSIYTVYQGHELMFHVSTMLPYSKENKQQVGG